MFKLNQIHIFRNAQNYKNYISLAKMYHITCLHLIYYNKITTVLNIINQFRVNI